jgi:hypothetical protein
LLGNFSASRAEFERAVDLRTDFEEGHAGLARAAAHLGDARGLESTIAAGLSRRGDLRGDLLAEEASALAVLDERERARERVREAEAAGALPLNLALAWAALGDAAAACEHLRRERWQLYWAPHALWWDPRFDAIRDDSRFLAVERRVAALWRPAWS